MLFNTKGEIIKKHLNQLCTMLTMTTGYYANFIDDRHEIGDLAINQSILEPHSDYIKNHIEKNSINYKDVSGILNLDYNDFIFYYHIFNKSNYKGSLFIGPMKIINSKSNSQDSKINDYFKLLPVIKQAQLSSFMELIFIIGDSRKHMQLKEVDLHFKEFENILPFKSEIKKSIKHHSLYSEEKIFNDLLTKDINVIDIVTKSFRNLILPPLADDHIRSQKNRVIVAVTIVARAAIKLGMTSEEAFSASDMFISEVEKLNTSTEILTFQFNILKYYREKIESLNNSNEYSESTCLLLEHIEDNLLDTSSLNNICDKLNLNYKYASKRFSTEVGETFSKIRENKRLEKAISLLDTSNLSINEIASITGFNYTYYFTKKFKLFYGVTPTQYRKKKNNIM